MKHGLIILVHMEPALAQRPPFMAEWSSRWAQPASSIVWQAEPEKCDATRIVRITRERACHVEFPVEDTGASNGKRSPTVGTGRLWVSAE